jgi:FeS assembly protein IscX
MASEMIVGKSLEEALRITNRAIAEALDGLPPVKMHCSVLAADALKMALADYYQRQGDVERARELAGEDWEPEPACPVTEDAAPLYWSELETIAEALAQSYPDVNPLDLGIPALFRRILSLPGFSDDPDVATEQMLEQIQMLWHEEATE